MKQNASYMKSIIIICTTILLLTLMAVSCSNNAVSDQNAPDNNSVASITENSNSSAVESPQTTTTVETAQTPTVENAAPRVMSFTISIRENGSPEGGIRTTHKVKKGDTVEFVINTAVAGVLHLHAWKLDWHAVPGTEVIDTFGAKTTGRYPLEFHIEGSKETGVPAGYIEIHP